MSLVSGDDVVVATEEEFRKLVERVEQGEKLEANDAAKYIKGRNWALLRERWRLREIDVDTTKPGGGGFVREGNETGLRVRNFSQNESGRREVEGNGSRVTVRSFPSQNQVDGRRASGRRERREEVDQETAEGKTLLLLKAIQAKNVRALVEFLPEGSARTEAEKLSDEELLARGSFWKPDKAALLDGWDGRIIASRYQRSEKSNGRRDRVNVYLAQILFSQDASKPANNAGFRPGGVVEWVAEAGGSWHFKGIRFRDDFGSRGRERYEDVLTEEDAYEQ